MILIVDDNDAIRELVEAVLSMSGYEVSSAACGEDALELLQSCSAGELPELILLDLTMPGLSGYQTMERMRKLFPADDIPVVFVSAYPPEEEYDQAMRMGARDYISKPFKIPALLQCVQTHVNRNLGSGVGSQELPSSAS